ncbi:MAG: LysR family transcriptional regulator [Dermatophilaceae bacterium]
MTGRVRSVDANLLLALHALLEERNLTHAGARMTMSQPAMSGALARLRRHFDDDLLVRNGREFDLTPLAARLRPMVSEAVEASERLLGSAREFVPGRHPKTFTVSLTEFTMTVLAEPLSQALAERAPNVTVAFDAIPIRRDQIDGLLMRRDLIVGPLGFDLPGRFQPLFSDRLVCVVSADNPRIVDGQLTIDDLRTMPHALANVLAGGTSRRPLESAFELADVVPRSPVLVSNLLALPYAVSGTDMCAFIPSRLAVRTSKILGLTVVDTPLIPVDIVEAAHWHPRRSQDPSGIWLRELLYDVAVELEDAREQPDT